MAKLLILVLKVLVRGVIIIAVVEIVIIVVVDIIVVERLGFVASTGQGQRKQMRSNWYAIIVQRSAIYRVCLKAPPEPCLGKAAVRLPVLVTGPP